MMMSDNCKNCGAGEGLHHFETMQCPRNGIEAPVGRKQEWQKTIYQSDADRARAEAAEQRVKALEDAARAMLKVYDRGSVIGTIGYDVCMKMREALK